MSPSQSGDRPGSWLAVVKVALALLLLNAAVSFDNLWPTPGITPDTRLAPEFVLLWTLLLLAVGLAGMPGPRLICGLALAYTLLVIGRYADVTAPALFGRSINLYWDGRQIPRFLAVSAQGLASWQTLAILLAVALLLWAIYRVVRLAILIAARDAAPHALRSRATLLITASAIVLVLANTAGVKATWPYVSRPVLPTYLHQADLLLTALSPTRLKDALPPSPTFDSDLAALERADVKLMFLESYGAVAFDNPALHQRLAASRDALAQQIAASGRQVVSAFVRSPTFGGASDLAHLGLLSGIDLSDPVRHDLLLTSQRPTLISLFHQRGYQTIGLYPALSWEWPERAYYGFDKFFDGPHLGYRGPRLGFWGIPDQFTVARIDQMLPAAPGSPARFLFFPTITSHLPFHPIPPYQPDWTRVLSPEPYDDADLAMSLADKSHWAAMLPAYGGMIEYTYRWLAGYLAQPAARDYVMILLGDHQPAASVSGPGAPWDVPVHLVSSNPALIERFIARGFRPGLEPQRPVLGSMDGLTRILLDGFDGGSTTGLQTVAARPKAEDRDHAAPARTGG